MHWLQTIDTALFRLINGSLSNPFCDWLMPIMSGGDGVMRWFIPLAVAVVVGTLCFGSARARLCALMIFLVIALGDPLVTNTIKHLVERPRPCMVLPGVVERLDAQRQLLRIGFGRLLGDPKPSLERRVDPALALQDQAQVEPGLDEGRGQQDGLAVGRLGPGQIVLLGEGDGQIELDEMVVRSLVAIQPGLVEDGRQAIQASGGELVRVLGDLVEVEVTLPGLHDLGRELRFIQRHPHLRQYLA